MSNSLVKFANRTDGNGRGKLYWGRADVDGLPFRGPTPPFYTQEEYEAKVVKVADPRNGTFDTGKEDQNKKYLEVIDGIANGWYRCIYVHRWLPEGQIHHVVYIEWVEYYLEDGSRAPASGLQGLPMEMMGHGQSTGHQAPG